MQIVVDISLPHILNLISQMNLDKIEEVKNKIVEKELYFKKFKKDDIKDVIGDFKKENYSEDFLKDLENDFKKVLFIMHIKSLRVDLEAYLKEHNIAKKFEESKRLFKNNSFHLSLNTELLDPKERLIYSFRLDKKCRAILFIQIRT